jgi:hypothetical protein
MAVHTVYVKPTLIDSNGNVVDKNDPATTIQQVALAAETDMRVIPDPLIPSSVNSPNIEDYLALEDLAGFSPVSVLNTMIVTEN